MASHLELAADTLAARKVERRTYAFYIEIEDRDGDYPSDLGMLARLTWLEASRALDRLCERDGISRYAYRWPA